MSNLTDLLPAGAGGKQVSFVASGTIGNGVTVGLNSDGTVTAVGITSQSVGAESIFESAVTEEAGIIYDPLENKIVIMYPDGGNSYYGTAVVGTISGETISFNTPIVFNSGSSTQMAALYDSANSQFVAFFRDALNSSYGSAVIGYFSGGSLTFDTGGKTTFTSETCFQIHASYDATNQKYVLVYRNQSNGYGKAVVGGATGLTQSYGSVIQFQGSSSSYMNTVYMPDSGNMLLVYVSTNMFVKVGTVSGNSISFTTGAETGDADDFTNVAYDTLNNKAVISYRGASNYLYAVVATISGTTVTLNTPVVAVSSTITYATNMYDPNARKVTTAYRHDSNSDYGTAISGAVSGTTISFDSPIVFNQGRTEYPVLGFDSSSKKIVIAYSDWGNSQYGTAAVFTNESSNNTDFIGISDAAISDTASGSVTIKGGISTNVTGLTPNSTYYVQANGTLSTTASDVLAGKALSSTSINLDYTT